MELTFSLVGGGEGPIITLNVGFPSGDWIHLRMPLLVALI